MIEAIVAWFGTGHERRAKALALVALVLLSLAAVGAAGAAANDDPRLTVDAERPVANTLVALQGYRHEGKVVELSPEGEVVWEYADGDDFFDVELLDEERVQLAVADEISDRSCPARYRDDGHENCVRNSLRIVDRETKETLWEYAWYDAKLHAHELHDADHYTVQGEDRWVLADMGNDRVFAVDRQKRIRWQWNATDDYERPEGMGPEGDWTHVNDVDRIAPGVFQVSLRNFDTVVELHVENGSVDVRPVVGPNAYDGEGGPLYEQHNPDRLADDHLLVADSEHDRVLELDGDGEVVWTVGGGARFDWPRDADRLPNGHTLVADSYNDRVVEVDERGEVVWAVETGRLPYEADRVPREGERSEPSNRTSGEAASREDEQSESSAERAGAKRHASREGSVERPTATDAALQSSVEEASYPRRAVAYAVSMAKYALPAPVAGQTFPLAGGLVALTLAGVERYRGRREERPDGTAITANERSE